MVKISVDDYRALAHECWWCVVKLFEDTWYNNPKAPSQVRNTCAEISISTYHFLDTQREARAGLFLHSSCTKRLTLQRVLLHG